MFSKMKYALVLGGGGSNGIYEMGVWKALKKLGIKFNAVIGNSVGALNGALIIQGDFKKALNIWENIGLDKIVMIPPELVKNGRLHIDLKSLKYINKLKDIIFKNRGLDTTPLKNLILKFINEKKIRNSKIDFGIITYQLESLKPMEIFLNEMPSGSMIDYLLASASLPGFKAAKIEGKAYADGGVYDNIPFNMAKGRGYKNIIIVDISGLGVNRKPDTVGTNSVYIRNSMDLSNIFDFNVEDLKKNLNLGYYDTLKTFGKISGIKYFYKYKKRTIKKLEKILLNEDVFNEYKKYLNKKIKFSNEIIKKEIKMILPIENRNYFNLMLPFAECAALSLNVERNHLYNFDEFLKVIYNKYIEIEKTKYNPFENKSILKFFTNELNNLKLVKDIKNLLTKSSFEYDMLFESIFPNDKLNLHEKIIENFSPNLLPAKIFFIVLKHYFE
jgi:NTE family protein